MNAIEFMTESGASQTLTRAEYIKRFGPAAWTEMARLARMRPRSLSAADGALRDRMQSEQDVNEAVAPYPACSQGARHEQ